MNVGEVTGNVVGGVAGAGLLGMLDGPLPFMDAVGGAVGGAIGGDIGKALSGKGKKRMAGQMLDPRILAMNMPMVNPNTQMMAGMGIVDPNPPKVLQEYAMY
mgnify:FL=1|jgi:hypothetical protein